MTAKFPEHVPFPEVPAYLDSRDRQRPQNRHNFAAPPEPEALVAHWACVGATADPSQPPIFVLHAPGAGPLELVTGEKKATFTRSGERVADPGALGLRIDVHQALVEQHGHDDDG